MERKIIDYKIVTGYWVKPKLMRQPSLESEVKKTISEGWKPQGSAFIVQSSDQAANPLLGQAMVKYQND